MKNSLILLALVAFCFSCNKSEQPLSERIIGEWQIHSFEINSCQDESENVPLTTADENGCVTFWGDEMCMSMSFLPDGTGTLSQQDGSGIQFFSQPMEYTVDEDRKVVTVLVENNEVNVFTLDGNQLMLEMDEDGCICEFGFES